MKEKIKLIEEMIVGKVDQKIINTTLLDLLALQTDLIQELQNDIVNIKEKGASGGGGGFGSFG